MKIRLDPRLRTKNLGQDTAKSLAVVQHIPVVGPHSWIQPHFLRLASGLKGHPFPFDEAIHPHNGGVLLRDDGHLDRNAAFAFAYDLNGRDPAPPRCPATLLLRLLHPSNRVVVQLRGVQPLGEEHREIAVRDLLRYLPKSGFIDVLELPALVKGLEDAMHGVIADDVAKLLEE